MSPPDAGSFQDHLEARQITVALTVLHQVANHCRPSLQ
jgi:hypothetical protein